jgi:hypothetical protein
VARYAYLRSKGHGDDDDGVQECLRAMAYYCVHKAVDAESGQLSPPGIDRLVDELRAVAHEELSRPVDRGVSGDLRFG